MSIHLYRRPITLDTLGDLFAHHRATFGGWSMEDAPPAPPAPAAPPAPGAPPAPPTDKPDDKPDGEKLLTQSDVNRIVRDRLEREQQKFADYDDLKTKAAEYDKLEAANASELEKAVKAARAEGASEVQERTNTILRAAEARALAAEAKFRNPSLAIRAIDLADVKVKDDGTVDSAAIKSKLDELATAEPYLIDDGKVRPKPDDAQGRSTGTQPASATATPGMGRMKSAYEERANK